MNPLLKEIRHNPLLWLPVFVPAIFACYKLTPESHTLLFDRHHHRRAGHQQRALGVVRRGPGTDGVCDLRHDALPVATQAAVKEPCAAPDGFRPREERR